MLGSHNTLTYFPIKGLFGSLKKNWSKCQEINYIQQYNCGVRYFDVRIKFDKNKPVVVHNNNTYKAGENELNQLFSFLNIKKDCYVRFGLDIRKKPKDADKQTKLFKEYIQSIQRKYPFIKIADAIIFWDWEHIINPLITVVERHASVTSTWELIKTPRNYASKHNKELKETYKDVLNSDKQVLLIDFVNL